MWKLGWLIRPLLAAAVGITATVGLIPASAANAATRQCTRQVEEGTTSGRALVPADSQGNRFCWLARGSRNEGVRALQFSMEFCYRNWLRDNDAEVGAIDGDFGPRTERALSFVQVFHSINADGEYGPQTASRMMHPVRNTDRCVTP
jgi:hypothetical protein